MTTMNTAEAMMNTVSRDFEVRADKLEWLQGQFSKLAKRAAKVGCPAPTISVGESRPMTERTKSGVEVVVLKAIVTITGEVPKYEGWTFAATLQHLAEGETVIHNTSLFEAPEQYRGAGPNCEHCQYKRKRNDTYLVVHDDGTWKQVGSTCIDEFLGGQGLDVLAKQADMIAEAFGLGQASLESMERGGPTGYSLVQFLSIVSMLVAERGGFVGRRKAYEDNVVSTADSALDLLADDDFVPAPETHRARAQHAATWAIDLADEGLTEFHHNLRAIARTGYVEKRTAGYAAAIILGWEKEQEKLDAQSQPQGTVGEQLSRRVRCRSVKACDTKYGVSYLHVFIDAQRNMYKWFASKDAGLKAGECYTITGKVKGHDSFRGVNQTVLTHVKAVA